MFKEHSEVNADYAENLSALWESLKALGTKLIAGAAIFVLLKKGASIFSGFKSLNFTSLLKGIGAIALIATTLAGTLALINSLHLENLQSNAAAFEVALAELLGVTALLALIAKTSFLEGGTAEKFMKLVTGMLGVSASLLLLSVAVYALGKIDFTTGLKGVLAASALLVALGAMLYLARDFGANGLKAAGLFLGASVAIVALTGAVALLGNMPGGVLAKGLGALAGLTAMLSILLAASHFASDAKGTLIGMSAAIAVLAGSLLILANFTDPGPLIAAAVGMSAVIAALALALKMTSVMPTNIGPLLAMTAMIAVLAGSLYLLASFTDMGSLAAAAMSLGGVLLAMAGALAICSVVGAAAVPALIGAGLLIAFITVMTGVVWLMGTLFSDLTVLEQGAQAMYKVGEAFGNLIGGFSAGIFSGLPAIGEAIAGFVSSIQSVADPAACQAIKDLAVALLAFTASEVLDSLVPWADTDLAGIGEQFGALGEGLKAFQEGAGDISPEKIGPATEALVNLAEFAKELPHEGFFKGKVDLKGFAENLKGLGEGLADFNGATEGLSSDRITALGEALNSLAEFAKTTASFSWNDKSASMSEFATGLKNMAPDLKEFLEEIKGVEVDAEKITAVSDALKTLADASKVIGSIGTGTILTGNTGETVETIKSFGEKLPDLAYNISRFTKKLEGVDAEKLTSLGTAMSSYADFTKSVSEIKMEDGDGLKEFGEDLKSFATPFAEFAEDLDGVDAGRIESLAAAMKSLGEFAQIVAGTGDGSSGSVLGGVADALTGGENIGDALGGVADALTGGKSAEKASEKLPDLTAFGEDLAGFAGQMALFDQAVKDVKVGRVTEAANAAKALAEFGQAAAGIGENGSGISDLNLSLLGAKLWTFGEKMAHFDQSVKDVKASRITEAASAASSLADFAGKVAGIQFEEGTALEKFGSDLENFGPHLKAYAEAIDGVGGKNVDKANQIVASLGTVTEVMKDLSGVDVTALASAVTQAKDLGTLVGTLGATDTGHVDNFITALQNLAQNGISAFLEAFSGQSEAGSLATAKGGELVEALVSGVTEGSDQFSGAFGAAADQGVSAVESRYNGFYKAAQYLIQGLINGLSSPDGLSRVAAAGGQLGDAAVGGLEGRTKINSPSKVTEQDGVWFAEGFIRALNNYAAKSRKAGSGMGEAALNGLNRSVSTITGVLNGSFDGQPSIRPVLDLSEIQNGMGRLDGMLAGKQLRASVSANMAGMARDSVERSRSMNRAMPSETASMPGESHVSFQNTFYITGSDPEKIAKATMRTIQRQWNRRDATWA